MVERRRMSESARKFLETGETQAPAPFESEVPPTESNNSETKEFSSDLREQLLGRKEATEPTTRFTVDLPKSLHRRLQQLSLDSGKPKTDLVREILSKVLNDIGY